MGITYLLFSKLQICLFNMPEESMNAPWVFFCWWLHYQVVCHLDKMPALATAQAGNELDALTLFNVIQTGGPALSPVALKIWSLHEWLRRSILHSVSRSLRTEGPPRGSQHWGPDCATGPVLDWRVAAEPQSISRRNPMTGASVAHSSALSTLRKMDWLANSPKEAKHAVKSLCITWLLICKVWWKRFFWERWIRGPAVKLDFWWKPRKV